MELNIKMSNMDSITKVRPLEQIESESPYLRGDEELSAYLRNISIPVLTKLRKNGLPYHKINTIYLYDKEEVRKWINTYIDLVLLLVPSFFDTVQQPEPETKRTIEGFVHPITRTRKKA